MNPQNDLFLSSAKDQQFKLWDLNSKDQIALGVVDLTNKKATPIGNFDPTGVIFAVAFADSNTFENMISQVNQIKLYDIEIFRSIFFLTLQW